MYKPFTYLIVTYFATYLPIYETYFLHNWLPRWNHILTHLRFIHNWVIRGIQWMVHWWVLVHNPALCCPLGITHSSSGLWMKFFWLGLSFSPPQPCGCCVRCSSFNPGGDFQIQMIFWVKKNWSQKPWVNSPAWWHPFSSAWWLATSSLLCREIHVMFCQCIQCRSKMSATNMVCDSAPPNLRWHMTWH